jgi:hypothetical protein
MTFAIKLYDTVYMVKMVVDKYVSGNTAVVLQDAETSEQFGVLSVNTEVALPEGHFYLKHWSENEALMPTLLNALAECKEHAPQQVGYVVTRCFTMQEAYEV